MTFLFQHMKNAEKKLLLMFTYQVI